MNKDYKFLYNAFILTNLAAIKHGICSSKGINCVACRNRTCSRIIPFQPNRYKCKPNEWIKKGNFKLTPVEMRKPMITMTAYCNKTNCKDCHLKGYKNVCLLKSQPFSKFALIAAKVKELIK